MQRKYGTLLKDTIIFALGSFGSKLILFLLVPLYTNCLSTDEYGIADLVFTISQLLIPFISLSICSGVLRFGLAKNENRDEVYCIGLFITIMSSIILVLITPILGVYDAIGPWKWYLCVYVILSDFLLLNLNYLKVLDMNRTYAIVSIFQTLILALLNILFLLVLNYGISGYLLSYIISCGIAVVISTVCVFKSGYNVFVQINKRLLIDMIMFSIPLIINDISWWIIHSSDKVMIESMVGDHELGLYSVAAKIPSFVNIFVVIFSQAWGISSIKEYENNNDSRFYSTVFDYYSTFVILATIVIISFTKIFIPIYVSSTFVESWHYVPVLVASAAFIAVSSFFGALYSAVKRNMNNMITTLIAAAVNIIVNYLLIQKIGTWGAIVGTIVSCFIVAVIRIIDIRRYVTIRIDWKRLVLNSAVLVYLGIVVSLDFYVALNCFVAISVYLIVNYRSLFTVIERLFSAFIRKFTGRVV